MGIAGDARIRRIAQTMISSSSVVPAWRGNSRARRGNSLCIGFSVWLLHLYGRFFGYKLQRPLLGIARIDLQDGKRGASRGHTLHDDAKNGAVAADAGGIGHASR